MAQKPLSSRLVDVLERAAKGLTDKEIAADLGVAAPTVESHWRRLRERYGSSSRTDIVARYLREIHTSEREALMAQHREALLRLQRERDSAREVFKSLYEGSVGNDGSDAPAEEGTVRHLALQLGQETARANRAEALVAAACAGGVHPFTVSTAFPPRFTLVGDNAFDVVGHLPEAIASGDFLPRTIDPDHWNAIAYAFPAAVDELRPDGFCYEYGMNTAAGEPIWIVTRCSFVYGDDAFPISYSGIGMNVTGLWPNSLRLLYFKNGAIHDRTPRD